MLSSEFVEMLIERGAVEVWGAIEMGNNTFWLFTNLKPFLLLKDFSIVTMSQFKEFLHRGVEEGNWMRGQRNGEMVVGEQLVECLYKVLSCHRIGQELLDEEEHTAFFLFDFSSSWRRLLRNSAISSVLIWS